jgi:hypothetical protein
MQRYEGLSQLAGTECLKIIVRIAAFVSSRSEPFVAVCRETSYRMDVINPIPALLPGLRDTALRGTLIPFVGAGASRLAGCPNWTEFADRALRYFVDQGKFSHGQLAQLSQQPPRVKLSIALGLGGETDAGTFVDSAF